MHETFISPPLRLRIRDSLDRVQTLGTGQEAFDMWAASTNTTQLLVLGLGPYRPAGGLGDVFTHDIGPQYTDICWVDCEDFHAALVEGHELETGQKLRSKQRLQHEKTQESANTPMLAPTPEHTSPPVPSHWRRISPKEALAQAPHRDIRVYRQNLRLFPEFWGPLWADISRQRLRLPLWPKAAPTVVLLHDAKALLARELDEAFTQAGFHVLHGSPDAGGTGGTRDTGPAGTAGKNRASMDAGKNAGAAHLLAKKNTANTTDSAFWQQLLQEQRPALVLSVNGQGLDAEGDLFHLLRACQVPVALWFVDNPWHILSRFRLPWWREAQLFCTDAAFMQPLRAVGAAHVAHIPLAVAPHMWEATPYSSPTAAEIPHGMLEKILFVGSLAFPQRQAFFGAASVPSPMLQEAFNLLEVEGNPLPHALWWAERLQAGQPLWPGHAARVVGLGAEESTLRKRLLWLTAAATYGLSHYGHRPGEEAALQNAAGYTPELGQVLHNSRPPVDYYTTLPRLYATASYTLNVTSLLLPYGLTQRHFDVWAAGGFLLTDDTQGLDIFPAELTAETRVSHPHALTKRIHALEGQNQRRHDIINAWQQHLRQHHTYGHRVASMCNAMGID